MASEDTTRTEEQTTGGARSDEETRHADFERYFAVRTHFGNLALSPDGREVAYIINTSGQLNIWRQPITGGWATQVTTFERASVRAILWAPSGELIGQADTNGSEQYQIFMIPATGGVPRFLTNRNDVRYELSEHSLSPDGRYLAYSGNDREPTDADVQVMALETGESSRVLSNGRRNLVGSWSPDGRFLLALDWRSNLDQHLSVLDTASGSIEEALPHDDSFMLLPGPWLPDSSGFYVLTNRGRDFLGIARYTLGGSDLEWVHTPPWDVEHFAISADGERRVWALNENGTSQLYLRDESSAPMRVVGLPRGVIDEMTLSPDGQTLLTRINTATAAQDVYVILLGEIGALDTPRLRRLTFSMLGGLPPERLVTPELVSYPTFDGRKIPAWLYRPEGVSEHHQAPVVVSIHGGPDWQERTRFNPLYQYLLSRGIGVLAPNIRGSTGYGAAYQRLIYRDWGGAELKDIEAAARYAQSLDWVSARRIGVYGGSFGGFATLSAMTRLPEYWAAGAEIVGPSNLLTFVRSVPPTWLRAMAEWVGDPEADEALLRERSPITYVEQIKAPLLIVQGANDPRVVKAESDQMVERLRGLGRDVEYVVFEDEGHGFVKRANQLRGYWLVAEFLERHLRAHRSGHR
ncbi:MAG TPA: S9 family peptidase [Ktedonobacterales bacterium]